MATSRITGVKHQRDDYNYFEPKKIKNGQKTTEISKQYFHKIENARTFDQMVTCFNDAVKEGYGNSLIGNIFIKRCKSFKQPDAAFKMVNQMRGRGIADEYTYGG